MSARHAHARGDSAPNGRNLILCPNCGSCNAASNLIDETPFRQAARSAVMLRRFGRSRAAGDVLTHLASIRIINFLRMKWCCQDCGVTYDA